MRTRSNETRLGITRRTRRRPILIFSAALWWVPAALGQEPTAVLHRIEDLPGGEIWTLVRGISADGSTVVGESWDESNIQPVRWTAAGGLQVLGALPGGPGGGASYAASADGSVIVGQAGSSLPSGEAFRWTAASGMVGLGAPAGADGATAHAVSQDGSVVAGFYSNEFNPHAFRWTAATGFQRINDIGGQDATSAALAMAADGATLAGYGATPLTLPITQAMLWSGGGAQVLGALTADGNSEVRAVTEGGSVAVGWSQSDDGIEAFRWTAAEGMVRLGMLPNGLPFSFANAVSADGDVIVGRAEGEFNTEAFLWTPATGMVAMAEIVSAAGVDLAGWMLTEATGVSADGLVIAGNGENENGDRVAWVVDLRDPNEAPGEGGEEQPGEEEPEEPAPPTHQCREHRPHGHPWHGFKKHCQPAPKPMCHWRVPHEKFRKLIACVESSRRHRRGVKLVIKAKSRGRR